jgi:hypothetical protein
MPRRRYWNALNGTSQIGQTSSPLNVGLRDHSMRTPGQYRQNFPRELAITERLCVNSRVILLRDTFEILF